MVTEQLAKPVNSYLPVKLLLTVVTFVKINVVSAGSSVTSRDSEITKLLEMIDLVNL